MTRHSPLERYKRMAHDRRSETDKSQDAGAVLFVPPTAREYGKLVAHVYRDLDVTLEQALDMLARSGVVDKNEREFTAGFNGYEPAVHFVGFKGDEFVRAQKVFGKPDFIHRHQDVRLVRGGELAPGDIVVFANGSELKMNLLAHNDSENM
jgi:hypothetical protein